MIIFGMGEFYFDIIVDCMKCEFKVEVNVGVFQVVYCEIFCIGVKVEGKFVCQFGGCGQFGYVWIEFELNEEGVCFEFENVIVGGVVLCEYILVV